MAKGVSPMKAKQQAANRRPYTPDQLMNYDPCGCDPVGVMPPPWVLDAAADRTLNGGYTPKMVKRVGVCTGCFTVRSAVGTCECVTGRLAAQ